MSDGNKFDATKTTFQRQQNRSPLDEMGNVLLDAMQAALICLDKQHIILDASQTVKKHFGFEQMEVIGLSILLLVEDSERYLFLKFLNSPQKISDVCRVRMMLNHINEYRPVKVHRRKKSNSETADVHSTTARPVSSAVETILVLTLEETSFIDITLHDINKQEFYTKMNLFGEIIFEDHRAALITGYLPNELCSHSIFDFVHHEDRLVKLHALWKCVTTGASKLQWRLNARNSSLVFLQTEYKLIFDSETHQETIIARNEVLSQVQRSQFDELQAAWRHQCTADIKGNNLSFKSISPLDVDNSFPVPGECRISVPSLNMCFTANKLQPLNLIGNIFEGTKLTRPLTIQDYINILIDKQKCTDHELMIIINNVESLSARYCRPNESEKAPTDCSETNVNMRDQSDPSGTRRQDSDSIVRGILKNSTQYNQPMTNDDSHSSPNRSFTGNSDNQMVQNPMHISSNLQSPTNDLSMDFIVQTTKSNQPVSYQDSQKKHADFLKKYAAVKHRFESQLAAMRHHEAVHGVQTNDAAKRKNILHKLAQLEAIKNREFSRQQPTRQQLLVQQPFRQSDSLDTQPNLFNCLLSTNNNSNNFASAETSPSALSPLSSLLSTTNDSSSSAFFPNHYHQHQKQQQQQQQMLSSAPQTPSQTFDSNFFDSVSQTKNSFFDEFLTPPPSSAPLSVSHLPGNHTSTVPAPSFMDVPYQGGSNDSLGTPSFQNNYHRPYSSNYPY